MRVYNGNEVFAPVHIVMESKVELDLLVELILKGSEVFRRAEMKNFLEVLRLRIKIL